MQSGGGGGARKGRGQAGGAPVGGGGRGAATSVDGRLFIDFLQPRVERRWKREGEARMRQQLGPCTMM